MRTILAPSRKHGSNILCLSVEQHEQIDPAPIELGKGQLCRCLKAVQADSHAR